MMSVTSPSWAERATVPRRLTERGLGRGPKRESLAVARLDDCPENLAGADSGEHIHPDEVTIPQVADVIAGSAGPPIAPNTGGAPTEHRPDGCAGTGSGCGTSGSTGPARRRPGQTRTGVGVTGVVSVLA